MIYLIITTSINNRFNQNDSNERMERYLYAISETLKVLPHEIKPLIVENNGKRDTYLDNFYHHHRQHVKVFYTDNNRQQFKSKGANELMDIKEVIDRYGIEDDDMIIKLTGRYRAISPKFFKDIIKNENDMENDIKNKNDAFIKFFGTCSLKFEEYDCILGCYAMRAKYIKLFNQYTIDNYKSAEIAFARYARFCGARLKEMENLDIECCFAEDGRKLIV
jgi:hypothetical protein